MHIITSDGQFQLPYPARPGLFGIFQIHPDGSLNRQTRRLIARYDFSYVLIEADPFGREQAGSKPADFHSATLKWSVKSASLIVAWAGGIPFDEVDFRKKLEAHARQGGRILLALVREEQLSEWMHYIADYADAKAQLLCVRTLSGVSADDLKPDRVIH